MVGGVLLFVYTWTDLTGVTVDDLAAFNMVKSPLLRRHLLASC